MNERKPTKLLQKIFDLRKKQRITLPKLGEVMGGITGTTAGHIENGNVPLKAEYLPAIAKLLGVSTWELFVDYDAEEIGPLSEQEKAMVLNLRKLSDESDWKAMKEIFKNLLEKVPKK